MIIYIVVFIIIWAIMFPVVGSSTNSGYEYENLNNEKVTLIVSFFLALLVTAFIYCAVNKVY